MKLELKDIRKSFGEKEILHGVSFAVESGRALGLLGRNGAGKTTTIRIIMDVFHANSGEIMLDGEIFHPTASQVGYLPEERGLYPKKKVRDQMVYLAMLRGMNKKQANESTVKWLDRLHVSEYIDRKLETLSKGNQQKVAATLVGEPQLVILDEPFSGLDPVNAQVLKDVIRELIREGRIVIFSSHQMSYVEEFCEDIAIINHGDVVLAGHLDDIKDTYGRGRKTISADNYSPQELADICREKLSSYAAVERVAKKYVVLELKTQADMWQILDICKQTGVEIHQFGAYEPSLNDIFISCVGDEEPDTEAAKEAV